MIAIYEVMFRDDKTRPWSIEFYLSATEAEKQYERRRQTYLECILVRSFREQLKPEKGKTR